MPTNHPPGDPAGRQAYGRTLTAAVGLTVLICLAMAAAAWRPLPRALGASALVDYPWFYLRDGEILAEGEDVLELIAVGDVMLGRGVAAVGRPFEEVAPLLRPADITLGNLEAVIAQGGVSRPGPYRLRAPPSAVDALSEAGFDILGLANNHALDFGPAALAETVSRLDAVGISTVGAGPDIEAAAQPLLIEIDGLRLAFLAFSAVTDPEDVAQASGWTRAEWDREQLAAAIASADCQADAVIVSAHWGYEYELHADPAQRDWAQAMLEAGADLVFGHHPHVVQSTEANMGGFVAYSLGNFAFDQGQIETRQGLALRALFDTKGLRAVQALPIWAGPRPRLMRPENAGALLARVAPTDGLRNVPSAALPQHGFTCAPLELEADRGKSPPCLVAEVPATVRTGLFSAGAIDLTGDGVQEQVRLIDGHIIIESGSTEPWHGLPEWHVVDVALGDPNDDGRGELLLALWKPDDQGTPRSHPFILGYRGGAYRVLWGGSAVADPIHEVELGDVDGDGVQELIVLEDLSAFQGPTGLRTVTVWDWHGWGFSLAWRSPPARYRDLALGRGEDGSPLTISVAEEP